MSTTHLTVNCFFIKNINIIHTQNYHKELNFFSYSLISFWLTYNTIVHLKVEQKCNFYSYLFNNDIITAFNELDRVCLFYLGWDKGAFINDVTQLGVGEKANTWVTLCIKIWDTSCVTSFMYDPLRSGKYI